MHIYMYINICRYIYILYTYIYIYIHIIYISIYMCIQTCIHEHVNIKSQYFSRFRIFFTFDDFFFKVVCGYHLWNTPQGPGLMPCRHT